MCRQFKFRAWDKIGNKFLIPYPDGFHIFGETTCFDLVMQQMKQDHPENATLAMLNDVVITQYSYMSDKNGKEIYEEDILKIKTEDVHYINVVCKFGIARRIMDTGWEVDIPSFYFERPDGLKSFPIVKNWNGKHDLEMLEIIGNTFENSDLLNESKI